MPILKTILLLLLFSVQNLIAQNSIKIVTQKKGVSMRGLSVPSAKVIWASGSKGSIAKSVNEGLSFEWLSVKGYEQRDFRSIHAWNHLEALIVAVAAPALILKTKDGGLSWYKVYENTDTAMFLDAIDFINNSDGFVVGDPINNSIFLLNTKDKGEHWAQVSENYFKSPLEKGEAFFASSSTNLTHFKKHLFLVSGGKVSRLWINGVATPMPIVQGGTSTGANSIAVAPNGDHLIIVGGDFSQDSASRNNIVSFKSAVSSKNSNYVIDWVGAPHGYKSCVQFISSSIVGVCGTSGVDISFNAGISWDLVSKESFHVLKKQPGKNALFLAGRDGRIGFLSFEK